MNKQHQLCSKYSMEQKGEKNDQFHSMKSLLAQYKN